MRKTLIVFILYFCASVTAFSAEQNTFGVIYGKGQSGYYGNPLKKINASTNYYQELEKLLLQFNTKDYYQGFDSNGQYKKLKLSHVSQEIQGAIGETFLEARNGITGNNLPILFWTSKTLSPIFINSTSVKINDKEKKILKNKIRELHKTALESVREKDRLLSEISEPTIKLPEDSNVAFINFPIILERKTSGVKYFDKRASAFFMYNIKSKEIIKSRFGHPEWISSSGDEIEIIKPIFFFKLNNKLMAFCEYSGSWEDYGYALIDVKSGKIIMNSY